MERLLEDFGPPRKSPHPELPFYHLQSDGVWEIDERVPLTRRKGSRNPLRTELRKFRIVGGLLAPIYEELKSRPEAIRALARQVLAAHFPDSLHQEIAAGCAFCGYAVQLDNTDLALEAAHIRWCQFGGPDTTDNGLACCSIHHQAFDRGAITISNDLRILVSSRLHGAGRLDDFFLALHGAPLPAPSLKQAEPNREFLEWHRTEFFRGLTRS